MQHYHNRLQKDRDVFVFDLDNTLYHHSTALFPQVDKRIGLYVQKLTGLNAEDARAHQKKLFMDHGTTLAGLMATAHVDPLDFLNFVHDIDFSAIQPDPELAKAIRQLGGRHLIYTNADRPYTEKVLDQLGISDLFDGMFDITAANLLPKPAPEAFDAFLQKFDISPERAIMFEDMARNLVPAAARGMGGVWIDTGEVWGRTDHSPHAVHAEISALTPWLAQYADDRDQA